MIKSRDNRRLKDIRRSRRCKGDRAVLEGPHLVGEAADAGIELIELVASPAFLDSDAGQAITRRLGRSPLAVDPALLDELADADSPRGLVALAHLGRGGAERLPPSPRGLYLYLAGVQDPGNLGALARVAEAAGADGMALGPGSVHPNHPRALRASAGSLLRLPVAIDVSPEALRRHLEPSSPKWVALTAGGASDLYSTPLSRPLVIAVGAEGPGLPEDILDLADLRVRIPMAAPVESLNVAVAAALVLYQVPGPPRG